MQRMKTSPKMGVMKGLGWGAQLPIMSAGENNDGLEGETVWRQGSLVSSGSAGATLTSRETAEKLYKHYLWTTLKTQLAKVLYKNTRLNVK